MFSLKKRKIQEDLIVAFQYLKRLMSNFKKYFFPEPVGFCVVFIVFPKLWLCIYEEVQICVKVDYKNILRYKSCICSLVQFKEKNIIRLEFRIVKVCCWIYVYTSNFYNIQEYFLNRRIRKFVKKNFGMTNQSHLFYIFNLLFPVKFEVLYIKYFYFYCHWKMELMWLMWPKYLIISNDNILYFHI